jgi:protein SDA1
MPKSRAGRGILVTSNLPQLQNLIKVGSSFLHGTHPEGRARAHPQRDPKGYREEFLTQYNHYLSLLRVYSLGQSSSTTHDKNEDLFEELITFVCQVAQCYPEDTKDLMPQLKGLLLGEGGNGGVAKGEVRRTVVKNLVMLRNKDVIDSVE